MAVVQRVSGAVGSSMLALAATDSCAFVVHDLKHRARTTNLRLTFCTLQRCHRTALSQWHACWATATRPRAAVSDRVVKRRACTKSLNHTVRSSKSGKVESQAKEGSGGQGLERAVRPAVQLRQSNPSIVSFGPDCCTRDVQCAASRQGRHSSSRQTERQQHHRGGTHHTIRKTDTNPQHCLLWQLCNHSSARVQRFQLIRRFFQ
mmetsp:Transcript_19932/g.48520  ORF Transcript_19932/g.48520 Transcript_19932/m.48520 type:complete len:205 (-) Transcript_19932:197-811(-)